MLKNGRQWSGEVGFSSKIRIRARRRYVQKIAGCQKTTVAPASRRLS